MKHARKFMKKLITKFLSLYAILLSTSNLQGENQLRELNDKIYVSPGSIYVASNAIYLNLNETFLLVETVSKDENGIYVTLSSDVRVGYCSKCGNTYSGSLHEHLKKCPANKA